MFPLSHTHTHTYIVDDVVLKPRALNGFYDAVIYARAAVGKGEETGGEFIGPAMRRKQAVYGV